VKQLAAGLQEHLDSGATTLVWCWRVTRKDGVVLGFTEHDKAIVFDGTAFEPESGMTASEVEATLGLSVDNLEVEGLLTSDAITEEDIVAGLYDDAAVEIWRVNWANPEQRDLHKTGSLGETTRGKTTFQAEFRGMSAKLQQPQGRLYQYTCDADLGDERCGVDLESPTYKGAGGVVATDGSHVITASGLGSYDDRWFDRGTLTFTYGANAGLSFEVKSHRIQGATVVLTLWLTTVFPIVEDDTFEVRAGCDKTFATCKAKFNNAVNFRGFPHMPGNEFVISYANPGDPGQDGEGNFNGAD
jgi:uncharacterized phage protein (TIGR02218 family)